MGQVLTPDIGLHGYPAAKATAKLGVNVSPNSPTCNRVPVSKNIRQKALTKSSRDGLRGNARGTTLGFAPDLPIAKGRMALPFDFGRKPTPHIGEKPAVQFVWMCMSDHFPQPPKRKNTKQNKTKNRPWPFVPLDRTTSRRLHLAAVALVV